MREITKAVLQILLWPIVLNAIAMSFYAWWDCIHSDSYNDLLFSILYMLTAIFLVLVTIAVLLAIHWMG